MSPEKARKSRAGGAVQIDDPKLLDIANRVIHTFQLSTSKAIAAKSDPEKFPLTSDPDSAEPIASSLFMKRDPTKQQVAIRKALGIVTASKQAQTEQFGDLADVNTHSVTSVEEQVRALEIPAHLRFEDGFWNGFSDLNNRLVTAPSQPHRGTITQGGGIQLQLDAITAKYLSLGAAQGFLGKALGPEGDTPGGHGRFQHFQGGSIYYSPGIGAHEVHGSIRDKWKSLGWEKSFLGYPQTDTTVAPDQVGHFAHFQGGSIYTSPKTGTHEVHGAIRDKWESLDWERGYLGYPTTDETSTPDTVGRFSHFQGGSVYWTPETGAQAVHIHVRDKWEALGWERGNLGYPITDTIGIKPGISLPSADLSNDFQGGTVTWSQALGARVGIPVTKLQFRVRRVACAAVTDGIGNDEIAMGGVAVDTNGVSSQVAQFRVGGNDFEFDQGTVKNFAPPLVFHQFDLQNVNGWPRTYLVYEMLAEIDSGGFTEVLKQLLEWVKKALSDFLSKAAGKMVGASAGAILGELAGPAGAAIGAVIGFIVGSLFDWIISLFDDDPFDPIPIQITLPSVHHKWSGSTTSPTQLYFCEAFGGHYDMWFDWQLLP